MTGEPRPASRARRAGPRRPRHPRRASINPMTKIKLLNDVVSAGNGNIDLHIGN
jgi:hypothetical protein